MEKKLIIFTADIPEDYAEKFDQIAKDNLRSRQKHVEFIVRREVEDFYPEVKDANTDS